MKFEINSKFLAMNEQVRPSEDPTSQKIFENSIQSSPYKKICKNPDDTNEVNQSVLVPSRDSSMNSSLQDSLGVSTRDPSKTLSTDKSMFSSLEFIYDLKYEKAICIEIHLISVPGEIDCIDYNEAKNYLKTLGGYFLKSLSPIMPPGRGFGDKDCLISLKIWNALFDLEERKQINLSTRKVRNFLKEIDEMNDKFTAKDWVLQFANFMLGFSADEFERRGYIRDPKRLMVYKMLTILLKMGSRFFCQIYRDLRALNIDIAWFKIAEIYKSKVSFHFKTDFSMGDEKLIEPLKIGLENKRYLSRYEEIPIQKHNMSKEAEAGTDNGSNEGQKSQKQEDKKGLKQDEKDQATSQETMTKTVFPLMAIQPLLGSISKFSQLNYTMGRQIPPGIDRLQMANRGLRLNNTPDFIRIDPESIPLPLSPKKFAECFVNFLPLNRIITDAPIQNFLTRMQDRSENSVSSCKIEN